MAKKSAVKSKAAEPVNSDNRNVDTSWRALFNFAEKGHLVVLLPAIFLSALSGILLPALAIIFGKFFDAFSDFGAGTIGDSEFTQRVLIDIYALIGLGGATWLLKGGYFTIWLVFGELQAKSVRDALFQNLLERDLEWYESRTTGVGSLLSRLQRCEYCCRSLTAADLDAVKFVSCRLALLSLSAFASAT
jgi:ATP-binding cassette, subfamily B (MDR/TAP), member 1